MATIKIDKPKLIIGDNYKDERGILSYINEFDLSFVKRFYTITHPNINVIRAWQGHQCEHKFFHVVEGSFLVAWVEIDNWANPSPNLKANFEIMTENTNAVLSIPAGYANGLKALKANSRIMVFSDHGLNESLDDKIRYDKNLWINWHQF